MPTWFRLLAAAACGGAVYAGFAPHGWLWLLALGLVGLIYLLEEATPKLAAAVGFGFGLGFLAPLLSWLSVLGYDAWLLVAVASAGFYALFGWAYARVRALPGRLLWASALWVGLEFARSEIPFGGFPWGRLAFATPDTPLVSFTRWIGVPATSGVIFLGCAALGLAVHRAATDRALRRQVAYAAAVPVGLLACGFVLPTGLADASGSTTVAAVQGDVPGTGPDSLGEQHQVTANHAEATVDYADRIRLGEATEPDIVVWPENSTDIDPFNNTEIYTRIDSAVQAIGAPTLLGAIVDGPGANQARNVGIVWDPNTGPTDQRYVKRHLVPFGEYIPFRDQIAPLFSRLDQVGRDMVPGDDPGVLDVGSVTVGTMMCFDVAYDDTIAANAKNGAQLMVVQTNNATYHGTNQPEQQWAIEQVRAVETGRDVVVASVNGITGFVSSDGNVYERTHSRDQQVLVQEVGLATGVTWGVHLGAWLERGLGALGLAGLVTVIVRQRRSDATAATDDAQDTQTPVEATAGAGPGDGDRSA